LRGDPGGGLFNLAVGAPIGTYFLGRLHNLGKSKQGCHSSSYRQGALSHPAQESPPGNVGCHFLCQTADSIKHD
jgi:hypothetical protein